MSKEVIEIIQSKLRFIERMTTKIIDNYMDDESYERRGDAYLDLIEVKKQAGILTYAEHKSFLERAHNDYQFANIANCDEKIDDNLGFSLEVESPIVSKIKETKAALKYLSNCDEYFFQRQRISINNKIKDNKLNRLQIPEPDCNESFVKSIENKDSLKRKFYEIYNRTKITERVVIENPILEDGDYEIPKAKPLKDSQNQSYSAGR